MAKNRRFLKLVYYERDGEEKVVNERQVEAVDIHEDFDLDFFKKTYIHFLMAHAVATVDKGGKVIGLIRSWHKGMKENERGWVKDAGLKEP
jgi:hypothetical protein